MKNELNNEPNQNVEIHLTHCLTISNESEHPYLEQDSSTINKINLEPKQITHNKHKSKIKSSEYIKNINWNKNEVNNNNRNNNNNKSNNSLENLLSNSSNVRQLNTNTNISKIGKDIHHNISSVPIQKTRDQLSQTNTKEVPSHLELPYFNLTSINLKEKLSHSVKLRNPRHYYNSFELIQENVLKRTLTCNDKHNKCFDRKEIINNKGKIKEENQQNKYKNIENNFSLEDSFINVTETNVMHKLQKKLIKNKNKIKLYVTNKNKSITKYNTNLKLKNIKNTFKNITKSITYENDWSKIHFNNNNNHNVNTFMDSSTLSIMKELNFEKHENKQKTNSNELHNQHQCNNNINIKDLNDNNKYIIPKIKPKQNQITTSNHLNNNNNLIKDNKDKALIPQNKQPHPIKNKETQNTISLSKEKNMFIPRITSSKYRLYSKQHSIQKESSLSPSGMENNNTTLGKFTTYKQTIPIHKITNPPKNKSMHDDNFRLLNKQQPSLHNNNQKRMPLTNISKLFNTNIQNQNAILTQSPQLQKSESNSSLKQMSTIQLHNHKKLKDTKVNNENMFFTINTNSTKIKSAKRLIHSNSTKVFNDNTLSKKQLKFRKPCSGITRDYMDKKKIFFMELMKDPTNPYTLYYGGNYNMKGNINYKCGDIGNGDNGKKFVFENMKRQGKGFGMNKDLMFENPDDFEKMSVFTFYNDGSNKGYFPKSNENRNGSCKMTKNKIMQYPSIYKYFACG